MVVVYIARGPFSCSPLVILPHTVAILDFSLPLVSVLALQNAANLPGGDRRRTASTSEPTRGFQLSLQPGGVVSPWEASASIFAAGR